MVKNDKVTALLDFEFCAEDWRAMEVAICLSKFAGEQDPWKFFEAFMAGFGAEGTLNADEIKAIPSLIKLRVVSNFVYFVGRYISGEDTLDTCISKLKSYHKRVFWVNENIDKISNLIQTNLRK